eukprot:TRINITY_DN2835_c0_g1_i6.p1 TRINITY_DN2835_c0_g1~~TRINITY_DN2835_c0_g1_i6.p1  ORF type:complete len:273 (-),score=52.00 TRINITY_DN2835_c0_g1_i6:259-1077(-)
MPQLDHTSFPPKDVPATHPAEQAMAGYTEEAIEKAIQLHNMSGVIPGGAKIPRTPEEDAERLTLVTQIQGLVSADVLLESLGQGVDNFEPRLVAERAEQQEREFSRKLRDEQDEAYQESLRMDREKEEKANQIRQEQQEQLKKQQQEEETKRLELERQQLKEQEFQNRIQMRKQQKGASLPEEPAVGTPSTTLIRIRLPDGSNQQRRFNDQDKVSVVYDFVCSLEALKCWKFSLASSYPRKVYGPETHSLNLQDAGLSPQAVLFVQPEDEEK